MELPPEQLDALRREITGTILSAVPEAVRRAMCGTYMDEERLMQETGLSKRSIRTLRENRTIPYTVVAGRALYPSDAVWKALNEGLIPARAPLHTDAPPGTRP
jgi:hypothetical protein